ncbi:MAG: hypothetical protein KGZ63_07545 [Clostridiales bacterium]|nr:hypothetical protein [Clostridiales bacterium]
MKKLRLIIITILLISLTMCYTQFTYAASSGTNYSVNIWLNTHDGQFKCVRMTHFVGYDYTLGQTITATTHYNNGLKKDYKQYGQYYGFTWDVRPRSTKWIQEDKSTGAQTIKANFTSFTSPPSGYINNDSMWGGYATGNVTYSSTVPSHLKLYIDDECLYGSLWTDPGSLIITNRHTIWN